MNRRKFLASTGVAVGTGALSTFLKGGSFTAVQQQTQPVSTPDNWAAIREQFNLSPSVINMAGFFFASHPKTVRDAIEKHRRGLDECPFTYLEDNVRTFETAVRSAASEYLKAHPDDFAITGSTTMGLGMIYSGLKLQQGDEILSTVHDHYSTNHALDLRAERTGATVRRIPLYKDIATVSEDEIVHMLSDQIRPNTRVVASTWVHSSTGLKLPIGKMADAIAASNSKRAQKDVILFCVDGVHGFGVEDVTISDLRCDFFMAGCHKWLFGPRGTGLIWGSARGWPLSSATIPTFDMMWRDGGFQQPLPQAQMTPGGFHAFEHRWALPEAFRLHMAIGKTRVANRIHELNRQCKEGLARMKHVKLYTPAADNLSAGIICFDVKGMTPEHVVERLRAKKVIGSTTPYEISYARVAPSLFNTPEEVETTLRAVRELAAA
ncbi:MAG: aminotransferase class V-fold PLP-dependent enzyme [Candidatus Acidiferrum sp.]